MRMMPMTTPELTAWVRAKLQEDKKWTGITLLAELNAQGYGTARQRLYGIVRASKKDPMVQAAKRQNKVRAEREAEGKPIITRDHREQVGRVYPGGTNPEDELRRYGFRITYSPRRTKGGAVIASKRWIAWVNKANYGDGGAKPLGYYRTRNLAFKAVIKYTRPVHGRNGTLYDSKVRKDISSVSFVIRAPGKAHAKVGVAA